MMPSRTPNYRTVEGLSTEDPMTASDKRWRLGLGVLTFVGIALIFAILVILVLRAVVVIS